MDLSDGIRQAVGPGKPNREEDVRRVQRLLNLQANRTGKVVTGTGRYDHPTQTALEIFQRRVLHMASATGVVAPHDGTLRGLNQMIGRPMAGVAAGLRLPPCVGDHVLREEDFTAAAKTLGCEVRAIKAVTMVEAPRGAFDESGRPSILFERHLFFRYTAGRHNRSAPDLSNPVQGGYGTYKAQYGRLERAVALDATAAFRATSWGAFQILGDNHNAAGYGTAELFVQAMCQSVQQQLAAFVAFIQASGVLLAAIEKKEWATFALHYNGKTYRKNHYDTNLQEAYAKAKD